MQLYRTNLNATAVKTIPLPFTILTLARANARLSAGVLTSFKNGFRTLSVAANAM